MTPAKILIVDDEESMLFFLSEMVAKEGYQYKTAVNGEKALRLLHTEPFDLVILDYNMPGRNGLDTFKEMSENHPDLVAIMITAFGNNNLAMDAMAHGVFDYFTKPFDIGEMRVVIRRCLERARLQREIRGLRQALEEAIPAGRILGKSRAIKDLLERVERVADNDVSVLLLGESGTGKELVGQALHYNSSRKLGPLIKVNCSAIPQELLEAELFGHEKGAFTGAVKRKRGKFELADSGTLFLDEIGDMPLAMQSKILRVIQEEELVRVGGEAVIPIDIRLITATNKNLHQAVADGEFREDLYYRLNVVSLQLPPLRERKEDIPILARHFLRVYNEKFKKDLQGISPEGLDLLTHYSWPGNIRELENVIQRGIVLAYDPVLDRKELLDVYPQLESEAPKKPSGVTLEDKIQSVLCATEKRLILEALESTNWKRQETADRLGISRKTLHNKMKKYGLGG